MTTTPRIPNLDEVDISNPAPPIATEQSEALAAMRSAKFRIPGDTIHKATQSLPTDQRDTLRWFGGYCRSKNLGKDEIAKLIRKPNSTECYSYDSLYHVLTGRRSEAGISIEAICNSIAAFRRITEERDSQVTSGFVETRLYKLIEERCLRALLRQKIGYVFGDSQIGKTACFRHFQTQHNHGTTTLIEMPSGGSLSGLLYELGKELGMPVNIRTADLRRRILASFDSRMLLIIDEAHRAVHSGTRSRLDALDFVRELWNRTQCGIVLSFTNEGRDALLRGPHAKSLEQLWRRRIQPLQLPSIPFADDLDRLATAYGLSPATDEVIKIETSLMDDDGRTVKRSHSDNPLRLQQHVVTTEGLGVWLMILQDASDMARTQQRDITWGAVIKAYCLSQSEGEMAR